MWYTTLYNYKLKCWYIYLSFSNFTKTPTKSKAQNYKQIVIGIKSLYY